MCASTPNIAPECRVVAGILCRGDEVLIARRERGPCQGQWEFPGGKVEAGESLEEALDRELLEEVGIRPLRARPFISFPSKGSIHLSFWRVDAFHGEPYPREGQALRWVKVEALHEIAMLAANAPVIKALRLPERYLITPEPGEKIAFLEHLEQRLREGIRLIQLRVKRYEPFIPLAREAGALCRDHGALLMVNGDPGRVKTAGASGIHLPSASLMALGRRPPFPWVAASCHDERELRKAQAIGVDFVVLSPVLATESHPSHAPLGWARFEALVSRASFPVYALGGMEEMHLPGVWSRGGHGIAAIRGLW